VRPSAKSAHIGRKRHDIKAVIRVQVAQQVQQRLARLLYFFTRHGTAGVEYENDIFGCDLTGRNVASGAASSMK
jgi:hypothetical protein